jgi:hypothetical protein
MGSSISNLSFIQQMLTRYGMSTYVAFGNLGNLLTIGVFIQRQHRQNPCSIYLLMMTICNLICLDVGIIPIIYSLNHIDITTQSFIACKIQFYIRHAFFQMMRTYKVLACIDRYAICSFKSTIRSFSSRKVAIYLILISAVFWLLLVIFFAVVRTIQNGSCNIFDSVYLMIYTIYYLIFAGILPPLLILIFSVLVMRTLKQIRSRVQPTATATKEDGQKKQSTNIIRKRDRDLLKMVFIEVLFYVFSTMPFSIFLLYKLGTDYTTIKSRNRLQIESFINYMAQSFIMYLNTALPFYIYIATSASFRRQTIRVIHNLFAFITRKQMRRDEDITQTITNNT